MIPIALLPWKTIALAATTAGCVVLRRQRNKLREKLADAQDKLKAAQLTAVHQADRAAFAEAQIAKVLTQQPPKLNLEPLKPFQALDSKKN